MKPSEKLKEIEKEYDGTKTPRYPTRNTMWLIARVKELEAALEWYALLETVEGNPPLNTLAKKALEGDDEKI